MLGSFGFFASRGMTTVPNLSGLSRTAAENAIVAAGLTVGTSTPTSSSVSSQDNVVGSQTLSYGQVVDYDTVVDFGYYTYTPPSPGGGGTPVVCIETGRQTYPVNWSGNCVGGTESGTQITEIDYSNCSTYTINDTVSRGCGSTPSCTGGGVETFQSCGDCVGGSQTCNYYSERYYDNCISSVTSYSYTQSCGPAPTPTPTPTPCPTCAPGPSVPIYYCIDGDTNVITITSNGEKVEKKVKDVEVGEYLLSMKWDELVDQNMSNYLTATSENLTNIETLPTMIIAKYQFQKNTTMYINNDVSTRMSLEQPILISRDGIWQWVQSGDIYIGDSFIKYISDNQVIEAEVTAVNYISETRDVYSFNCEDTDTFFAGTVLVHNK